MVRFPYSLEVLWEEEAALNPDGSYTEGLREWRRVCRCNVRQNGQAKQIMGQNGQAFVYSYEVTMPSRTMPVPIGTRVRILDRDMADILAGGPCGNSCGDASPCYAVLGFCRGGQRNEDATLWL